MLVWTKLPSVHRKGKHFFTTTHNETRYWFTQRCGLVGYWQVEDNYGAVWGSFDTAKQAMNAAEQMGSASTQLEWLWANCKIVYWCKEDLGYPIEHNPHAKKYARDLIEREMPNH